MQQYLQNKKGLVQGVFDKVYDKYDIMNDLMSLGVHRIWKRNLINWMNPGKNKILADVACGTGDIAKLFSKFTDNNSEILCVEPNKKMLAKGKEKLSEFKNIKCKGIEGVYPCKNPLKIVDLLTHRSGYVYYLENGENWLTGTHRSLYPKYINTSRFNNLDDFSKAVAQQPLEFEPGTMYSYGLNQAILGRLIEVLSGQSFYEFLKDNISGDYSNKKIMSSKDKKYVIE